MTASSRLRAATALILLALAAALPRQGGHRAVIVDEGTSMSVAASPDGRTLAIDLQGAIWTLPVAGGTATRITDIEHDARQPNWAPDGRTVVFQGYDEDGFDLWQVARDGGAMRRLTWGPYDDREPTHSPDGRFVAFSSDRSGNTDIWVLELESGALRQLTRDTGDDYMPTFSPDGREVAFVGTRGGKIGVHAITIETGAERTFPTGSGRVDAPSWGPGGTLVHHEGTATMSRLMRGDAPLTGEANAFPFRTGWLGAEEIVYVADGRIRRQPLAGGAAREIPLRATLEVVRPAYAARRRDVDGRTPQAARGIVGPVISPDGSQIAFVALGDLYLMPRGGTPRNVTRDAALDADPSWSPDGRYLAWASDRAGDALLDLWILDTRTNVMRRLTTEPTSAMAPTWSPDGTRLAFLDVDGIWRAASVAMVEVATGRVTALHPQLFGPGAPAWSPNGRRVLITALRRYSARFREGTNQLLSIATTGEPPVWHVPVEHLSIDSRVGAGPAISPDGTTMALVYEGQLALLPIAPDGTPLGPPRRVTSEIAHAPSWTADGGVLYQANERLRLLETSTGVAVDVPLALRYSPQRPTGRTLVHAGRLVDGTDGPARTDVDILLDGNRIVRVAPHAAHPAGMAVVDATGLTVMPGLIEYHTHLQKDFGANANRAYLAFGITSVRSPGSTPYEAIEDREAVEAGTRPGPRLFVTGYLMEWQRVYYKMAVAVSSPAHLTRELERGRALGFDLFKSYVRMPDAQQRRIAEFAHTMGVPAASHEIYPAARNGMDGTEHTTGTSRRGYSPKAASLNRSYADVAQLFAASGMPITPTLALSGGGLRELYARVSGLATDPRFALYPAWMRQTPGAGAAPSAAASAMAAGGAGAGGQMVMGLFRAGTRVVAGTDTPNAATLHGELLSYVLAGMTPAEALRTATRDAAAQLGIDAGIIAPGKLADLAIVAGDPLTDITATTRVKWTIADGRVFEVSRLVAP
ncbi:MAG: PD40 domain-containing protein [Gemmatimonadetes bacterium]|nr:PD40 domain-containing protein [Gemmatimonadota bacterium]